VDEQITHGREIHVLSNGKASEEAKGEEESETEDETDQL
jgi:hypothetical protein